MSPTSEVMQRALDAARAVRGATSPNPWVGAVLVRNGVVAGAGATSPPGGPHAEAAALTAAGPGGGELFTTLEPCMPFPGKRTPACTEAILAAGVSRVVVAIEDPDPAVRGRGIAYLRAAGVTVDVGDGAAAALDLLRPYLKHRATALPYVVAKFAASLDGRIATRTGDSHWITGPAARERAHEGRAAADAILVGSGTVLADDPALTARPGGTLAKRQPLRVIVDARGRVSPVARLFREPGSVLVATTVAAAASWKQQIVDAGARVVECEPGHPGVNLHQLAAALGSRGVLSLWAEGGGQLLGSLFAAGLVDETWAFIAPLIVGGDGRPAVAGEGPDSLAGAWRLRDTVVEQLGDDLLVRGYTGGWSPT